MCGEWVSSLRCRRRLTGATVAATLCVGLPDSANAGVAHHYGYTGSEQWFDVPPGATTLWFSGAGGAGGSTGFLGGRGARITRASVSAVPGERLFVEVGGYGGRPPSPALCNGSGPRGGTLAGSGGGAIDLRRVSVFSSFCGLQAPMSLNARVVVAAGGGGATQFAAGGAAGQDGQNPPPIIVQVATGGKAGSASHGGAGGQVGGGAAPLPPSPVAGTTRASLLAIGQRVSRSGTATLRIRCDGPATCSGRATPAIRVQRRRAKPRWTPVGSAAVRNLAPGRTATVTVRLSRAARAQLRRRGRLAVRATVSIVQPDRRSATTGERGATLRATRSR
jgi:hypothetical protein